MKPTKSLKREVQAELAGKQVRMFIYMLGRLVVRYERHAENFLGFLHLACLLILRHP